MQIASINPHETAQARHLLQSLTTWLESRSSEELRTGRYNAALDSVNSAIIETRKYLKRQHEGKKRDAETEDQLSRLWSNASSEIRPYDSNLAELCMIKGHGWADPALWDQPEYKTLPIRVDQMLTHLREVARRPTPPLPLPSWFPAAAAIFTLLTVLSLFYLIIRPEDVAPGKRIIFDVWVAFCVAASVSFIGGTARAQGRLPWLGNTPIRFLAYGGVGVFVVTLVLMYSIYH